MNNRLQSTGDTFKQTPGRRARGPLSHLSPARIGLICALAGVLLLLPALGHTADDGIPRNLRGKLFMSPTPLSPPPDADAFGPYLQSKDTRTFKANPDGDWTINFIAIFRGALGNSSCHLVLYEEIEGKKNVVDYFTFNVDPTITTLSSHVTLTRARFNPGKKYELKVATINKAKKEQVLHTTKITLQ